ncbi:MULTISPECIES: PaaI family thioesterase [Protofrankia]|uniref:PaaI family thioesterase n=1 Tax=Protofrankia TaxID=2994361 RepID=UPI000A736E1F|nr:MULTISPECIES: acyl-CoA thioesterase domain-containing protein [Protofrankia]
MSATTGGPDAAPLPSDRPVPFVMGIPEQLFRVEPFQFRPGGLVTSAMCLGPWLSTNGPDQGPGLAMTPAGALGVLIDDVLGYAIGAVAGTWSISTEITLDIVRDLPLDGTMVHAEGRVVHADEVGALARGRVRTESGDVVAYCQERGRWIDRSPPEDVIANGVVTTDEPLDVGTLAGLFGHAVTVRPPHMDVTALPRLANPLGNLHGGVTLCLTDWLAALTLPRPARTVSIHVHYVRNIPPLTNVQLTANIEHPGQSLGTIRVVATNGTGKPCTIGTVVRH